MAVNKVTKFDQDAMRAFEAKMSVPGSDHDIEAGRLLASAADKSFTGKEAEVPPNPLAELFRDTEQIRAKFHSFAENLNNLDALHNSMKSQTTGTGKKKSSDTLRDTIAATYDLAKQCKVDLEVLTNKHKAGPDKTKWIADDRVKNNIVGSLALKYSELIKDFQEKQVLYESTLKAKSKRELKIVCGDKYTDEQIEEIYDSGKAEEIFKSSFTAERGEAESKLQEVSEQNKDIRLLEQSVEELHQLFQDMALLVAAQGQLIDAIESNVSGALEYTKAGKESVIKAAEYACGARQKKVVIGVLIGVCVLILIIILAVLLR